MHKYRKLENLEIDSSTDSKAINKPRYKRGVFGSMINWAQLTVISLLKSIRHFIDKAIAKIVSKESNVEKSVDIDTDKNLLVQEEEREMEAVENTLGPRLPSYNEAINGGPLTYEETLNDNPPAYEETLENDKIKAEIDDYKRYLGKWQAKGDSSSAQKSKGRINQWLEVQDSQANSNMGIVKRSASVTDLDSEEHVSKRLKTQAKPSKRSASTDLDSEEHVSKRLKTQAKPSKRSASVAGLDSESSVSPCKATRTVTSMSSEESVRKWLEAQDFQAESNKRSANVAGLDSESSVSPCKAARNEVPNSVTLNGAQNMKQMFDMLDSMDRRIEEADAITKQSSQQSHDLFMEIHRTASSVSDSTSMSNVLSHQAVTKLPSMSSEEESTSKWFGIHHFQTNSSEGSSSDASSSETESSVSGFSNMSKALSHQAATEMPGISLQGHTSKWGEIYNSQANSSKGSASVADSSETASSVSGFSGVLNSLLHQALTEPSMSSQDRVSKWFEAQDADSVIGLDDTICENITIPTESSVSGSSSVLSASTESLYLSDIESVDSSETESFHSWEAESSDSFETESFHSCEAESVLSLTPEPVEKVWRPLRAFVNFVMRPFRATEVVQDSIVRSKEGSIRLNCEPAQERVPTPIPPCEEVTPNAQSNELKERLNEAQAKSTPSQHERSVLQGVQLSRLRDPETAKELIDTPFMRP